LDDHPSAQLNLIPAPPFRASTTQPGLFPDIPGVVAFVAVRLVLPIGLKVGVGLVLAVAPG